MSCKNMSLEWDWKEGDFEKLRPLMKAYKQDKFL